MARPKAIRAPTASSLPNNLRIPSSTPALVKTLGKLSRPSLLDLVFIWLSEKHVQVNSPFLAQDEIDSADDQEASPYPAMRSLDEVREAYEDLQARKGGKREVIDRILEGDWRHGVTLNQLAMADIRDLEDHPSSQKWTALQLVSVNKKQESELESAELSACLPRLQVSTFLQNLQREIAPLVKAHFYLSRSKSLPLTFLRIFVTDGPYQYPRHTPAAYLDSSRIIHVAFPDSSPYVYTSISSSTATKPVAATAASPLVTDSRSLQRIIRDGIPKALSRPQERFGLEATSLTAKSLHALLALRGPGRTNMANGSFSIFADAVVEGTPLDSRLSSTVSPVDYRATADLSNSKENVRPPGTNSDQHGRGKRTAHSTPDDEENSRATKKRRLAVCARFGTAGTPTSQVALDRLDIRLLDRLDEEGEENVDIAENDADAEIPQPSLSLSFTGTDVITGLRKLAEAGVVDPDRMPSWMTGEEGVSSALIRRGRRVPHLADGR